jgi:hypothetical protein
MADLGAPTVHPITSLTMSVLTANHLASVKASDGSRLIVQDVQIVQTVQGLKNARFACSEHFGLALSPLHFAT